VKARRRSRHVLVHPLGGNAATHWLARGGRERADIGLVYPSKLVLSHSHSPFRTHSDVQLSLEPLSGFNVEESDILPGPEVHVMRGILRRNA